MNELSDVFVGRES